MNIIEKLDYAPIFSYMNDCLQNFLSLNLTACKDKDYFLRYYNENKQDLYTLLGNNFIVSKEINIEKSVFDLDNDFANLLSGYGKYSKYHGYNFYREFNKTIEKLDMERIEKDKLLRLLTSHVLSDDFVCYNINFTINEKTYKFSIGTKPMTIIKKLVSLLDIKYFEDFRLGHSMVLNDRISKGTLSLSIHPLDYMTMSDNKESWSSCMSWRKDGCYKRGTIEMMNSPYVVVAYLSSEKNHLRWANGTTNSCEWNSKKWRQLFIVHPDIITSIKAYPYNNETLTEKAIAWIKELATTNLNYSYNDKLYKTNTPYEDSKDGILPIKHFDIYTDAMYNDFGTTKHFMYFSNDIQDICLNYSGESQCIVCGDYDKDFEHEGSLACDDCSGEVYYCLHCGERGHEDEGRWIDGDWVCDSCYDKYYNYCELCDSDYHIEASEVETVYLFATENIDNRSWAERYMCEHCREYYQPRYNSESDTYYFLPDDVNASKIFGPYLVSRVKRSEEYLSKLKEV